ncbi:hypothetical protein KHS38_12910 [Mucilaginibacter sp. Bleaf8]|uniref:hypothetical protein n=1 Tax=Mucilaginibacter sp. Bleaf8 TaxID=2834430 RepID=UPI001BCCA6D5|nr:hypothetical protein [Mucilaginibacter sp. Bleaf8]MBS7565306.1 hypothetical protein [Mucilaginibacter sp. Bleaf8]
MGRSGTGAATTKGSHRIELTYLLKQGLIQKGKQINGSLSWESRGEKTGEIRIDSDYRPGEGGHLRLRYRLTTGGQDYDYDYSIELVEQASNLGKGAVLYMVCPESGKRCRILYRAYSSHRWKARDAYQNRIYYPIQLSSKMNRYNDRYWELEKQLEAEYSKRLNSGYKGKPTKRMIRRGELEDRQQLMDLLRWGPMAMPLNLRRAVFK